jgi:hypothetical protein
MALSASSFFAGVATVIATVATGFGGGVLLTDVLVGASEKPSSLVARRAAELQPVAAVTAAQGSANPAPVVVAPPAAVPAAASGPDTSSAAAQHPRPADESFAKAREADLQKAAAAERRKAQRRKWAERRKREAKRLEHQAADQARRAMQREQGPGRALFAEPPHVRIFGSD